MKTIKSIFKYFMYTVLCFSAFIIVMGLFTAVFSDKVPETTEPVISKSFFIKMEKVLMKEKQIEEVHWRNNTWNIGMLPDGTKRHGYGSYVCEVLKSYGVKHTNVRLYNVSLIDNKKDYQKASMGFVNCETYKFSEAGIK